MTSNSFELLPEESSQPKRPCCQHLQKVFTTHPCLYGFIFISILTLDLAEITNDWLLFKDVSSIEQGLVYGPLSPAHLMLLLLTTAIGSLVITFEILNITRDICSGQPWADLDLDSALVIWLAEIPTISVNLVISLCHSEPVSYFQLTKCLIIVLSVFLRILVPLLRMYLARTEDATKKPFRISIYKVVSTVGLCLVLSGSISIFIFTHVLAVDEKHFKFRLPTQIWSGQFAYEEYFRNVGIYFHHDDLKSASTDEVWLKLADIHEFYNNDIITVKVTYTMSTKKEIQKLVLNSFNRTDERFRECYHLVKTENGTIEYSYVDSCSTTFITANEIAEKLIVQFKFIRPGMPLILGDIIFNMKHLANFVCYNITANGTTLYHNVNNVNKKPIKLGKLLYMKQETSLLASHRLVHKNVSSNQTTSSLLYQANHFMKTAEDIWKTGMYGCECKGKHGPSLDGNVTVAC